MVHRFDATLALGGAISRLISLLALGALFTACHDAERSLAPRVNGPRFNLSPTEAVNGKIAFHSTRDGDFQIYVMNPDGSGVSRVTNDTGGSVDPIWSPDGKRIAYANFHSGRSEVFVINVVGTGETQLTTDGGFPGAWSPDGTRIAFANSSDGDDEIFLMNPDGRGVTRLTDNTFRDFPTAWSPNGAQILFQSDRDGDEELYVMNTDGTGVTRLTNSPGRDEGDRAGWSPDGTRIVFSSDRDAGLLHVFAMQTDGSGVSQLTSGNFVDDDPVWSPDGARIAFHSTRDGGDEDIFVLNLDGSGVTQLTFNDGVFDAVPVWTQAVAVSNDAFANATVISALPFSDAVDISAASMEAGEPPSSCSGGASSQRPVWYSFTPAVTALVKASGNAGFSTVVGVYTGGLGGLAEITCRSPFVVRDATFLAQAGRTYHIQVDGMFGQTGVLELRLEVVPPPANDLFVDATVVPSLPFSDTRDLTAASLEAGEPTTPSCARPYGPLTSSAWYRFTPTETGSISANTFNSGFPTVVAAYTGTSVASLTEVGCGVFGNRSTFRAVANTTYYLQVGGLFGQTGSLQFGLEVTPPPVANFGFFPFDASVFDVVQFFDQSFDPGGVGFAPQAWTFGDRTTGNGGNPTHRYAADGDYTVALTATTLDGRTAVVTQTVHVRTHDVAITRFAAPNAASSGQTRHIVVSVTSRRYAETVELQVFKSGPGGFQQFGSLTQSLPLGPGNGTTDFAFSYTFTTDDAQIGKVTFKAVAVISGVRDGLQADNEAIAPPTKVSH